MYVNLLASRIPGGLCRSLSVQSTPPRLCIPAVSFRNSRSVHLAPSTSQSKPRRHCQRAMASAAPMVEQIKEKNDKYPVMIYAKSWCPYCGQVKGLFKKLQVDFQAVNLDEIHEGEEIQDELAGITGSHTVPQVFIKGEFIGGCDETMTLSRNGKLKEKLDNAGIKAVF